MAVDDIDLGWRDVIKRLTDCDGKEVTVGIHRDTGTEENGVSILAVATYNEYGTKRGIPSRPFVRLTFDRNHKAWGDIAEKGIGKIIARRAKAKDVLEDIGKQAKKDMQSVFGNTSLLKSNAPSTIKKKGRDEPLVEHGDMKAAVDFKVR